MKSVNTMPSSYQVEIADFEDTDEIMKLLESIEEATDDIDPDFTMFFIVRDKEKTKIIGCAGLEIFTGTALLRSFAIDLKYQEEDIGSNLISQVLEEAFDRGSETVYVCAKNTPSFFWDEGFKGIDLDDVPGEIRDSRLFLKDCPHVAAFVKKRVM